MKEIVNPDSASNIELNENKIHFQNEYQYNTYICSIPMDFASVPVHWHDEFEMIVIKKGRGYVTLNFQRYKVSSGDIVIVLPGMLHSIEGKQNSTMEYENILFSKHFLAFGADDVTQQKFIDPFFNGDIQIRHYLTPGHTLYKEISTIIDLLDEKSDERDYAYQLFIKGGLIQIIYLLITHPPKINETAQSDKHEEKLKSIIRYISTHYYEDISIEEIADFCHYSPSHFMKFF